jgi:hypothetical protein
MTLKITGLHNLSNYEVFSVIWNLLTDGSEFFLFASRRHADFLRSTGFSNIYFKVLKNFDLIKLQTILGITPIRKATFPNWNLHIRWIMFLFSTMSRHAKNILAFFDSKYLNI